MLVEDSEQSRTWSNIFQHQAANVVFKPTNMLHQQCRMILLHQNDKENNLFILFFYPYYFSVVFHKMPCS